MFPYQIVDYLTSLYLIDMPIFNKMVDKCLKMANYPHAGLGTTMRVIESI